MRKFIKGRYEGTNLEIMPSKAATTLPNGTPIREAVTDSLTPTQLAHAAGDIDVHARQVFTDMVSGEYYAFVGPTIAQQWRSEYQSYRTQRGWRARYYKGDPICLYEEEDY